jgi:hypothetical protein
MLAFTNWEIRAMGWQVVVVTELARLVGIDSLTIIMAECRTSLRLPLVAMACIVKSECRTGLVINTPF